MEPNRAALHAFEASGEVTSSSRFEFCLTVLGWLELFCLTFLRFWGFGFGLFFAERKVFEIFGPLGFYRWVWFCLTGGFGDVFGLFWGF